MTTRRWTPRPRRWAPARSHDGIFSPKVGAAYKVTDTVELYANWGRGFHSNDVRGAVTATPTPVLVRGVGKEVGARFQLAHFTLTTTYYWLDVGSELKFVGDSNAVEPTGASNRRGYEIVAFWRPFPWLALDGNYTASHARYDNGDYIPNAFENAASAGVSLVSDKWEGSVRMRHLGPYPLIEDNSFRDKGSTVFNARGAPQVREHRGLCRAAEHLQQPGQGHHLLLRVLHPRLRRRAHRGQAQPGGRAAHPARRRQVQVLRTGQSRRRFFLGAAA